MSYLVSQDGLEALRTQLSGLREEYAELRSKLSELRQLKDAEDFDLVEDTMRLEFLDKEIMRVQHIVTRAKIVRANPGTGTVQVGSRVRLKQGAREMYCMVVGVLEANPSEGKISSESPLGRALLGKVMNALVEVVAPRARLSYKIVGIDS